MKKFTKVFASLALAFAIIVPQTNLFVNGEGEKTSFLFTNDVHGEISGYAQLAGLEDYLDDTQDVWLVDAGDAVQGQPIAGLTKGEAIVNIMNEVGYDFAIPGNHEFDYGMDGFMNLVKLADYGYYSSNFVDLKTEKTVFDAYKVFDTNVGKVALVGVTTPEAFTKSTPKYFQDENGKYIYSFCEGNNGKDLYAAVQKAVDAAHKEADFVIVVGHTGIDGASSPWTSKEIIANTTGIDAFIDGHSHSTVDGEKVKTKDGKEILLAQTGTKFANIGQLELTKKGTEIEASVELLTKDELTTMGVTADEDTTAYVNGIKEKFDEILNVEIGESEVDLVTNDADGNRIIRTTPTNLGDLCADAYKTIMGAEIGFMNGGGIRDVISKGKLTYGDLVAVFPFSNSGTLIEATGQQILDALEMSLSDWPNENGGYLHTSGITYEFHSYLPSNVVKDDKKVFVKVDGEYRVKNVMVNGEPLDLNKTYKVASHDYMLKNGGDGYSMFAGSTILKDATIVDNELFIQYIQENLGGKITAKDYGKVRVSRIDVTEKPLVDKTNLEKAIEEVSKLKEADYTKESWKALKDALAAAKEVLADENATVEDVQAALGALVDAKEGLKKAAESPDTSDPYQVMNYGISAITALAALGYIEKRRRFK